MHGYQPGAVHPTTELVLSHKHPDDKADPAIQRLKKCVFIAISYVMCYWGRDESRR